VKGDFFMNKKQIYPMVLTALFVAIGLVLSVFSYMVYFGGGAGMRIGFSSYVSTLPSFLFGPVYGGAAMGIMDVLAYIIKPDGPFMLPLTLTAILGGVLRGILWKFFKNRKLSFTACICAFVAVFLFGLANSFFKDADCAYSRFISGFGKKTVFFTVVPMIFGAISAVLLIINKLLCKTGLHSESYIAVLATLMPANIIVTTINTALLLMLIPSLSKLTFSVFYLPRLVEEIANTSIQSFVVSHLLKLTNKIHKFN